MAYYEAVADAAMIAQSRMELFYEALHDKAQARIAREEAAERQMPDHPASDTSAEIGSAPARRADED